MGNTESSPPKQKRRPSFKKRDGPDFRGAGCLFTNGEVILAGYQKKRGDIVITGLGGKREEEESYVDTALRETVEELFHVKEVPPKLIEALKTHMKPVSIRGKEVPGWGVYVMVIYTFEDLKTLLKYAERASIRTKLYDTFPKTVSDLLLERGTGPNSSPPEIAYLSIIPLDPDYANAPIQPEFLEDMEAIHRKSNP
jgi:hypothetical protein